jgi:RNA polymerase sigma-70 factor (ECF subfamily)
MTSDSDRLLIQQIRGGRDVDSAWTELVNRYEGRLHAYIRRRLRDHATTDDIVQEVFIGFLNSLPNYDDKRDLQSWLFTIASHKVTDQLRKIGRQLYGVGKDSDAERMAQATDDRQRPASTQARSQERRGLEAEAIARGLRDMIRTYRDRGDYDRIKVLELLFVKGLPNKEAAVRVGVNEQQVANYRFAAVKRLVEQMENAGLPVDVFPELQS